MRSRNWDRLAEIAPHEAYRCLTSLVLLWVRSSPPLGRSRRPPLADLSPPLGWSHRQFSFSLWSLIFVVVVVVVVVVVWVVAFWWFLCYVVVGFVWIVVDFLWVVVDFLWVLMCGWWWILWYKICLEVEKITVKMWKFCRKIAFFRMLPNTKNCFLI